MHVNKTSNDSRFQLLSIGSIQRKCVPWVGKKQACFLLAELDHVKTKNKCHIPIFCPLGFLLIWFCFVFPQMTIPTWIRQHSVRSWRSCCRQLIPQDQAAEAFRLWIKAGSSLGPTGEPWTRLNLSDTSCPALGPCWAQQSSPAVREQRAPWYLSESRSEKVEQVHWGRHGDRRTR